MERCLKIPYGIKDFKRIRNEGYYYVDKTAYVRRMEERDREAKAQLAKYRADRSVPSLARGTTLHQIVYVFRGTALHVLEQVMCESMA